MKKLNASFANPTNLFVAYILSSEMCAHGVNMTIFLVNKNVGLYLVCIHYIVLNTMVMRYSLIYHCEEIELHAIHDQMPS